MLFGLLVVLSKSGWKWWLHGLGQAGGLVCRLDAFVKNKLLGLQRLWGQKNWLGGLGLKLGRV